MIRQRFTGELWTATLAEFNASTRKFKLGDVLMPTDSAEVRYATGKVRFSSLTSFPAGTLPKSNLVALLGTTTNLTAIGASFADLAAARSSVNQLRTDTESRLDGIEGKVDELIGALKTAGLMKLT